MNAEAIHAIVVGALRDNVNAHGNTVEGSWIGSAAKRIVHQLPHALRAQHGALSVHQALLELAHKVGDHPDAMFEGAPLNEPFCKAVAALEAAEGPLLEVRIRPLLASGMVGRDDRGHALILIDSEQSAGEQVIALFHELLHLVGIRDEDQVEAMARRLAATCPEVIDAIKEANPL